LNPRNTCAVGATLGCPRRRALGRRPLRSDGACTAERIRGTYYNAWLLFMTALLALPTVGARAQGDPPPPDTHGNDFELGRNLSSGTAGPQVAAWFADKNRSVTEWLMTPLKLTPNIMGPNSDGSNSPGQLYYNLGSNAVVVSTQQGDIETLARTIMRRVSISTGLEVWKGSIRYFAPDGTPVASSSPNMFRYGLHSATDYGWHHHFGVRAFRPGRYTFAIQYTDGVGTSDNMNLTSSQVYTLMLENLPVMTSKAILDGWAKVDTSRNLTGNRTRVFLFPADITPTRESQAIRFTDVYLDNSGNFAIPELLAGINSNGGTYRIGVRPLTVTSCLAKLYPEPVTFSTTNPPTVPKLILPNGDANRDGSIDVLDLDLLIQNFDRCQGDAGYNTQPDFNGDHCVDVLDLDILIRNFDQIRDFNP
jgi:hypothetical protein